MDSILVSVKKMLGIDESYLVFDTDIIIHINTVLSILHQLGIGADEGFQIDSDEQTWADLFGDDPRLNFIKSYVYLKVRSLFDPPTGSVLESLNRSISELEWRINVAVDPKPW